MKLFKQVFIAIISLILSACSGETIIKQEEVKSISNYPAKSIAAKEEGKTLLIASVDELGVIQKIEIKESSGFSSLDNAAINTVKNWTFKPAIKNNKPIATKVLIPISFKLNPESQNKNGLNKDPR